MQAFRRSVALMGAFFLAFSAGIAHAEAVSPCVGAQVRCRAAERFLEVTYELELRNPGERPVEVTLLEPLDTLERVEGLKGDLVLNRVGDALRASVPAGWEGRVVVRARQRISRPGGRAAFRARLPVPPAAWRTIEADLPGPRAELSVSPDAVVRLLGEAEGRSRFRIVPLTGGVLDLEWTQLPSARPAAYAFCQDHELTESPPEFRDRVALEFRFDGAPPESLTVQVPPDAYVLDVECPQGITWRRSADTLQARLPEDFAGDRITLTCDVAGATHEAAGGVHSLRVPVFGCPGAARTEGRVRVAGGNHELSFERLEGASQTAAEGGAYKLSCEFRRPDPVIAVRIVPIRVPARASVQTHYEISAYKVAGEHHVKVDYGQPAPPTVLLLPEGHIVRRVQGRTRLDWTQQGQRLRVEPPSPGATAVEFTALTEALTAARRRFELAPPAVADVSSTDWSVGLSAAPDVQLKTGGPAEPWRVAPERLPQWLQRKAPAAGYAYRDKELAIELEVYPVQPELGGTVQDHATVLEGRVLREVLFLLEVRKRPVAELCVLLPPGLTAERVDGPLIESWEQPADGTELLIRFGEPVSGPLHFRLVAAEPAEAGALRLHGIALRDAPHLKGWLAISSDVSTSVRPMEDGQTNLRSLRIEQAPDYLKAFDNKLLYELYDSRWWLDLHTEPVPPLYSAQVLEVLRFRAAQIEATSFVRVAVERGGVNELEFELPAGAASPRFEGPDVVLSQGEGRAWRVRFSGRRTGAFDCRLHYDVVSGMGPATVDVEPVKLRGAKEQSGLLLLLQARPDVEVVPGSPPAALAAVDAEDDYAPWSYRRDLPALAAYAYRGADWTLPVAVETQALSDIMLSALIPLAKLDTLLQDNDETLHHLRLYVSNTNRQFLTVDLDALGQDARLVGTYAFGEPIKPFREGERKLQLPLFTSERAAKLGMSVIDITYATPQGALRPFGKQSLAAPDLGLNVGQLEWTVRVPEGCRLAAVGGNMGKPVGPAPAPSLAGRLLRAVRWWLRSHVGLLILLAVIAAACAAGYAVVRFYIRHRDSLGKLLPTLGKALIVLLILLVLAGLLMPATTRARKAARSASQSSNLHTVGLGIAMYRTESGGEFPPALEDVVSRGYLDDPSLLRWDEQEMVYRRPPADAADGDVVAYFWPPVSGGASVVYVDGAVEFLRLDDEHRLVNRRMGDELVAVWRPEDEAGREIAMRTKFGKAEIDTEELQEAFQFETQVGQAGRPIAAADARRRQEALDEIAIEANRKRIAAALERYRADHNGNEPASARALDPYLGDRELTEVLERSDRASSRKRSATAGVEMAQPAEAADKKQLAADRYNLGMALVERGDYEAAEQNLRQALDFDGDYVQARSQLRQVEAMKRVASKEVKAALADKPDAPEEGRGRVRLKGAEDLSRVARQLAEREQVVAADGVAMQARGGAPADQLRGRGTVSRLEPSTGPAAALMPEAVPQGAAVAAPAAPEPALRFRKGTLVKQLGGGRSAGALPIAIDFPAPKSTAYQFVKPFLGRTSAALWFRPVGRAAALTAELLLAAAAFAVFMVLRRRGAGAAVPFAGLALIASLAAVVAAPPAAAGLFAGTALAMALCLAAEALRFVPGLARKGRSQES